MQILKSLAPYQREEYRLRKLYNETFRVLDYFSNTFSLMLYIFLMLASTSFTSTLFVTIFVVPLFQIY